jgi:anti-anti-sigma factor
MALPPCPATVETVPHGDRVSVTVRGELDVEALQIQDDLHDALCRSGSGIDLDLDGVGFCDCSGLNLLLDLRQRALSQGKTVALRGSSPAVERLLDLTGAKALFSRHTPDTAHRADHGGHDTDPCEDTGQALRSEVDQLRRAMRTRPTIDLARGILMASFSLSPEAAWTVLVTTSQNTNTKLHHLACTLVSAVHGTTLPQTVRAQLAAAVARANAASAAPPNGSRQHAITSARPHATSEGPGRIPASPG